MEVGVGAGESRMRDRMIWTTVVAAEADIFSMAWRGAGEVKKEIKTNKYLGLCTLCNTLGRGGCCTRLLLVHR